LTIGGTTNGIVTFNFTGNPGAARAGSISLLGYNIAVNQSALPYTATLALTNRVVSQNAGSDSVVLKIVPVTGSNWTATANAPWLHLSAANQSGTTSTNVIYSYDANVSSTTRTGTVTIANQSLTVIQCGTNHGAVSLGLPLVSSGLNLPHGVAVDPIGNVFILDSYNGLMKRWNPANNSVSVVISNGLNLAFGLATDSAGNVYIADTYNSTIKKWNAASGSVSSLVSTGLSLPFAVATDSVGDVYIADTYGYSIKKWTVASSTLSTLVSTGLNLPTGIAVDAAGNVYIGDTYNNAVKKWRPNTGTTTLIASGLNLPSGLAVDGAGNIFIADRNNHTIKQWHVASSSVVSLVSTGLNLPQSVATSTDGSLYIADTYNQTLREFPRGFVDQTPRTIGNAAGSSTISAVLPAVNLLPPFAPTSSQPWLSINDAQNGMVTFSVTANSGGSRLANLTVLGRIIPISQTLIVSAPSLSFAPIPTGLKLSFAANPGQVYQIESASNVTGPWITNTVLIGNGSGILNYTNPIAPTGNRFFRTRTP